MVESPWDTSSATELLKTLEDANLEIPKGLPQAIVDSTEEVSATLIKWLLDLNLWNSGSWLPIHSLHLLAARKEKAAVPAIIQTMDIEEAGQWLGESFPDALAHYGPSNNEELLKYLQETSRDAFSRAAMAESLWRIAATHEQSRPPIKKALISIVEQEKDKDLIASILPKLADIGDEDCQQAIKEAFRRRVVADKKHTQQETNRCLKLKRGWHLSQKIKDPMEHFSPSNLGFLRELQSLTARGLTE